MQLKRYKTEIDPYFNKSDEELAIKLSELKNERMLIDYNRLGLSKDKNIYHYVTRDEGKFVIQETLYPIVNLDNLRKFKRTNTAFAWSDGHKTYKYTYGDSQIWQYFNSDADDTLVLNQFDVNIIENPFDFLLKSYFNFIDDFKKAESSEDIVEVYLPLYSYRTKEVELKSGLNAWNAAPKNKNSSSLRPLNEVYIPIPLEFHKKYPDFFCPDVFEIQRRQKNYDVFESEGTVANIFKRKGDVAIHHLKDNIDLIPGYIRLDSLEKELETKNYKDMLLYMWLEDNYEPKNFGKYDFILIDCHPDFSTATRNAVVVSHAVLSPVVPSKFGYSATFNIQERLEEFKAETFDFKTRKSYVTADLYFLGNMIKHNTNSSRELVEQLQGNDNVLSTIPYRELFNRSTLDKVSLSEMKEDKVLYQKHKKFFDSINCTFKTITDKIAM